MTLSRAEIRLDAKLPNGYSITGRDEQYLAMGRNIRGTIDEFCFNELITKGEIIILLCQR